jgi:hypothetical protein
VSNKDLVEPSVEQAPNTRVTSGPLRITYFNSSAVPPEILRLWLNVLSFHE